MFFCHSQLEQSPCPREFDERRSLLNTTHGFYGGCFSTSDNGPEVSRDFSCKQTSKVQTFEQIGHITHSEMAW